MSPRTKLMLAVLFGVVSACADSDLSATSSSPPAERTFERRAYDGAPPVTPHPDFEGSCVSCHLEDGRPRTEVAGLGTAPRSPHGKASGVGPNCSQCHVPQRTSATFVKTSWAGLEPAVAADFGATDPPPPIPHRILLRERCTACHSGPEAPPSVAMDHPRRANCRQCHVTTSNTETPQLNNADWRSQ